MKLFNTSVNFWKAIIALFVLPLTVNASIAQSFPAISNTFYRYDASDLSSMTKDANNLVTKLNDLSGNNRHLAEGTGVTYNSAGYIELTSGKTLYTDVVISQPYSVYLVSYINTFTQLTNIVAFSDGNSNGIQMVASSDLAVSPLAGSGWPASNKRGFYNKMNRWDCYVSHVNGINTKVMLNGLPHHEGNAGTENISRIQLGNTNGAFIKELIIVSGSISLADDKAIRQYLLDKHSITDNSKFILGLGDSNTFPTDSYLELAANDMNYGTFNRGIPGSQLPDAAGQFQNAAKHSLGPVNGWLTSMFGTNGNWNPGYKNEYKSYLQSWIAAGFAPSKIIIITPPIQAGNDAKLQAYLADNILIANELGIHHFDAYTLTVTNGGSSLLSDGTHLNAAGNRLMADALKVFFQSNTPLPVHLTGFSATNQQGKNLISWKLTEPQLVASFEVERSADGTNFSKIGTIISNHGSTLQFYIFTDASPAKGTNFYRLKCIQYNSEVIYSRVLTVQMESKKGLSVFPSPVNTTLNLQVSSPTDPWARISDMTGRIVKVVKLEHPTSSTTSIDVSGLVQGIYFISVGIEIIKFVKL